MIETNMQQQQQDTIFQQPFHSQAETQIGTGTGPMVTCSICDAVYAPSPQQAPFLGYGQETLEATFMGICHFCFRCRRAACPQCWDELHGVCGSCVQEAGLSFRAGATPLHGLMFPPTGQASALSSQPQNSSLFILIRNGRFYRAAETQPEAGPSDITTEHTPAFTPAASQTGAPASQFADRQQADPDIPANIVAAQAGENRAANENQIDSVVIPTKTPTPEDLQETDEQDKTPPAAKAKKAKKVSRLELVLTWIVLVVVVALVVTIAVAEFIPAVNTAIAHVTHIDIRGEIAYLIHIVQQLFKR